jgi:MFS superfamily sulfate permease-like transporter
MSETRPDAAGLGRDLRAGITVAGILLPEAFAYAALAGLPPYHAIIAGIVGMLAYAGVGGSRFAVVAPTSSSSVILAAGLAGMALDPATREQAAFAAVLMSGAFFLAAGMAGLGVLAGFVSRPVLRGFAFGVGITIASKQLPAIAGVSASGGNPLLLIWHLLAAVGSWNWISVAVGGAALGLVVLLRRWRWLPGAALVLGLGMLAGGVLPHVALVGQMTPPRWGAGWPVLSWQRWEQLAQFALPLTLILLAESWGSMRGLALLHGDVISANRELRALGLANMVSGLLRGMPVGAGFSASSASEAAGAKSRRAGLVAAAVMALMLAWGRGAIALLPQPVLAAVVISALFHALDPGPLLRLWRIGRDEYVALSAALAVMALGVLDGMLVAVALSLLALLRRLAGARVAELGQLPGTHDFIDRSRNPHAVRQDQILVLRPAEPLFFANAERVLAEVVSMAQTQQSRVVIVSVEETPDFDSTALEALLECEQRLRGMGKTLLLARVKDEAREGLSRAGGKIECFWSVADAFDHAKTLEAGPRPWKRD